MCATPFKFAACRSAEPSASGHKGLILQWALYFQGELPVINTWLISHVSTHARVRPYVRTYVLLDWALSLSSLCEGDGTCNLKYDLTAMKMVAYSL